MPRVFISYKRADKDKVFPLKDKIEAAIGEPCWIDLDGIESDAWFVNVIMKAINEADIFLFMYSLEHSQIKNYEKDWTTREINFAQKKNKRIVFINIDKTPLSDWFEFMYGLKQQVDATSENAFAKFLSDMRKWLGGSEIKIEEKKKDSFKVTKPIPSGYVDLGLASGTIWKKQSERGLYTFKDALQKYGQCIPSKDMYHELLNKCEWTWEENGYKVTGPNGNSIKLLAQGYQSGSQILDENGCGHYWTNKLQTDTYAYALEFSTNKIEIREHFISYARAVHLIDA